jgi:hypothetical protein
VILSATKVRFAGSTWTVVTDATGALAKRLQNADLGAATVNTALASPPSYVELTFTAVAGTPYRLWLRGKALNNRRSNDSVYVQFSGAIDATGAPAYQIGSTNAAPVILEDCTNCGVEGWGWADNGFGTLGPTITFAVTGSQTMRIQAREDGLGIDQIVLSPSTYLTKAPGLTKNDQTILVK